MKICFFGPANNYHIQKWCRWFCDRGHEVHVISFRSYQIDGCIVHYIPIFSNAESSDINKLSMFLKAREVRRVVRTIDPDIINVHYASSYGAVAAFSGIKPYVLSVWGADIYDFPKKSFLHKIILQYSLNNANWLFSTSKAMSKEGNKYTRKQFEITPFGVDMNLFNPSLRENNNEKFVIGTVKGLSDKYGIDYLLKAVRLFREEHPEINLELRIAGKGPKEQEYKQMAYELGIADITIWLGFISQERVAMEWANMDIGVIYSTLDSESFGVSAVECNACGTPAIIADIPGLMEATSPGNSCIVVPRCNEVLLARAIDELYESNVDREQMGIRGRFFAMNNYEINSCFEKIENLFINYIKGGS